MLRQLLLIVELRFLGKPLIHTAGEDHHIQLSGTFGKCHFNLTHVLYKVSNFLLNSHHLDSFDL